MPNSPNGTGGYTIQRPDHWVFNGTSLKSGDQLGAEEIVVGYECDGCELATKNGKQTPTHTDGTPQSFEILGIAPARLWKTSQAPDQLADNYIGELNWVAERIGGNDTAEVRKRFENGHAILGTFRQGKGEVFTTGCTDWAYGLNNKNISTVTNNVLQRFVSTKRSTNRGS